jgi:prepilin-type N-terminal cleavage/methylation domain-containing protein
MAASRALRGFTLVEMLVALVVLSLVIGISTYAYALFARQWDGKLGRFEQAQAEYQRLEWLAAALQDTLPYVVRDDDGQIGFYFLGRDEGLTLVTMSPIFQTAQPALIRVFREPDGDGAWQLVYEEAPFDGQLLVRSDQRLEFRHRIVIARGLPRPEFRYYGWPDLSTWLMASEVSGAARSWFVEYDGMTRRYHPEIIELRIGNSPTAFAVPARVESQIAAQGPDA